MKDFTINEAADEAALSFPGIPQDVIRHICNTAMSRMLDIVENDKGRIRLQHCDVHTVYFEIVPAEQRAAFADLDESRVLTEVEEQQTIIERQNAKPNLLRRVKRLNRRYKGIHYEGFSPDATYPQ